MFNWKPLQIEVILKAEALYNYWEIVKCQKELESMWLLNKIPQQPKSNKNTTPDFNLILYVGQTWLMCTNSALFVF